MQNAIHQDCFMLHTIQSSSLDNSFSIHIKKQVKAQSMISTRKGSNDSTDAKPKYKTQMCKYWLMKIACPFEEICSFAHGQDEIRSRETLPSKYKTRRCSKFDRDGYCPYGVRCQFIHDQTKQTIKYEDIISKIRNGYSQFLEEIQNSCNKKRRRLSFFENISIESDVNFVYADKNAQFQEWEFNICNKIRHNSI